MSSSRGTVSRKNLLWILYLKKVFAAARESKSFIATGKFNMNKISGALQVTDHSNYYNSFFPSTDPTFTMENIGQIIVKIEPKQRLLVLRTTVNSFRVEDVLLEYSTDSEKEHAFVHFPHR